MSRTRGRVGFYYLLALFPDLLVLVALLVLDVAVPDYDINPGVLLPVLGAICALLGLEASAVWRGVK